MDLVDVISSLSLPHMHGWRTAGTEDHEQRYVFIELAIGRTNLFPQRAEQKPDNPKA